MYISYQNYGHQVESCDARYSSDDKKTRFDQNKNKYIRIFVSKDLPSRENSSVGYHKRYLIALNWI